MYPLNIKKKSITYEIRKHYRAWKFPYSEGAPIIHITQLYTKEILCGGKYLYKNKYKIETA